MLEYDPDMYYRTQQRFRWSYDLYRQASGAFWFPPGHASLDGTEAGISLAENPSIAFDYIANGATELTVTAKDTDDTVFTHKLPLNPGS